MLKLLLNYNWKFCRAFTISVALKKEREREIQTRHLNLTLTLITPTFWIERLVFLRHPHPRLACLDSVSDSSLWLRLPSQNRLWAAVRMAPATKSSSQWWLQPCPGQCKHLEHGPAHRLSIWWLLHFCLAHCLSCVCGVCVCVCVSTSHI